MLSHRKKLWRLAQEEEEEGQEGQEGQETV
jgi:hypothetical protein